MVHVFKHLFLFLFVNYHFIIVKTSTTSGKLTSPDSTVDSGYSTTKDLATIRNDLTATTLDNDLTATTLDNEISQEMSTTTGPNMESTRVQQAITKGYTTTASESISTTNSNQPTTTTQQDNSINSNTNTKDRHDYTWIAYVIVCIVMVPIVGIYIYFQIRAINKKEKNERELQQL